MLTKHTKPKMYKNEKNTYVHKTCTNDSCITFFEIQHIYGLIQRMTFVIYELIGPILQNTLNDVGPTPHGLKFSYPQLVMSLVIQEDEVSLYEGVRRNQLVKMSFDPLILCFDYLSSKAAGFIQPF